MTGLSLPVCACCEPAQPIREHEDREKLLATLASAYLFLSTYTGPVPEETQITVAPGRASLQILETAGDWDERLTVVDKFAAFHSVETVRKSDPLGTAYWARAGRVSMFTIGLARDGEH